MAYPYTLLCLFLALVLLPLHSNAASTFQIGIVHRDSLLSPTHNKSATPFDNVKRAIQRSFAREKALASITHANVSINASRHAKRSDLFSTPVRGGGFEFLMKIYLGTQFYPIWAIIDTGSALTWTQCFPCKACYQQNDLLYAPDFSLLYKSALCTDDLCQGAGITSCGADSHCNYLYSYADGSYTAGNLITDQVSFSTTTGIHVSFQKVYLGCGYANAGVFSPEQDGIVGLANSPLSLTNQIGVTVFSYCLPAYGTSVESKITFGPLALSDPGLVTTPLYTYSSYYYPFYFFSITGFRVGDSEITPWFYDYTGGYTIIDSGTTLSFIPWDLYYGIVYALSSSVNYQENYDVEYQTGLYPCYNVPSSDTFTIPQIVVHFDGGDLELSVKNTFLEVEPGVQCFAFAPSYYYFYNIWGNIAQTNFIVQYDIGNGQLKFQPTDCSTFT